MRIIAVIVAGLLLMPAGCRKGPSLPAPVQVAGQITLNGKPVDSAMVSFSAISEGLPGQYRYATGTTNANGEYSIPKVYPAEYLVQIIKNDPSAAPVNPDQVVADPSANSPFAPYGNESPLRALVTPEATKFDFELSKKK